MKYNVAFQLLLVKYHTFLILFRSHTGLIDNYWCPVTGAIERNETPMDMLKREGITVASMGFSTIDYESPSEKYLGLDIFFVSTCWQGDVVNKEPHKHDQLSWFDGDQIPSNTVPAVAASNM